MTKENMQKFWDLVDKNAHTALEVGVPVELVNTFAMVVSMMDYLKGEGAAEAPAKELQQKPQPVKAPQSHILQDFKPWDNDEREVIEEVEKLGCKSLDEIKGWSTLRPPDDLCLRFRLHINSRAAILPRNWNEAKNFILVRIMSRNGLPYRCFSE